MLRSILLGVVGLGVLALLGVRLYLERLAKPRLEAAATAALGVETTIDRMSLGLLAGAAGFRGLEVSNPAGFQGDYLLRVGSVDLGVELPSLLRREIVLGRILLDEVRLDLQRGVRSANYGVVLENVGSAGAGDEGGGGGRRVVVREVRLNDVRATVRILPGLDLLAGDRTALEIEIPEMRLENVGAEGSERQVAEEVTRRVVAALLRAVRRQANGLPLGLSREPLGDGDRVHPPGPEPGTPAGGGSGRKLLGGAGRVLDALGRRTEEKP